jgi:IS30 family transposase
MFSSVGSHAGTSLPNDPFRASLNKRSSHQKGSARPFPVSRHRPTPARQGDLKPYPLPKESDQDPTSLDHTLNRKEGDLIVGAGLRSAIATLVERKSRHTILVPIRGGHSAQQVGDALIGVFRALPPALRRTLTWDQGNEMFHHQRIEQQTGVKIYFADAHSPWQRGTNENTNGLLRQYFPKSSDLGLVTDNRLREVTDELNDRPRECLDDRSPRQVMARWRHHLISS